MPDRKRLRREYLRNQFYGVLKYLALSVVSVAFLTVTVWMAFKATYFYQYAKALTDPVASPHIELPYTIAFVCAGIAGVAGSLTFAIGRLVPRALNDLGRTYVPPVTPDTLPAEEILVRAADVPPVVQSDVLLRAAQRRQETTKEELLRMSQGECTADEQPYPS